MKNCLLIFFIPILIATTNCFSKSSAEYKIKSYLKMNYADASETSRNFIYNAVDLNNDGKEEYLVGLIGGDWCGSGGCTMLLFNSSFKLVTRMTIVNYPVYIGVPGGNEITNGYSNLFIQNRDGSVAKMAWKGKKYPTNPSVAPKVDKKVLKEKFKYLDIEKQEQFTF